MSTTILICDNNESTHTYLIPYLTEMHMHCISAYSGNEALNIAEYSHVDFIVTNVLLPDISGIEIIKEIRRTKETPILCLSARNSEYDRILPLELGANDLVCTPFSPKEVALRIQKILKRIEKPLSQKQIRFSNLRIDTATYTAFVNNTLLGLTPKELLLLALLASNPDTVFSREHILQSVWNDTIFTNERVVDTHIKRLRKKIPDSANFTIHSIYGVGYKLSK